MRNQTKDAYAFSLDEIIKGTKIKRLTHERLIEIPEIVPCLAKDKKNDKMWYAYESMEKQFHDILDEMVKKGKIKEIIKDDKTFYSAK